jgi:hypothetical protein
MKVTLELPDALLLNTPADAACVQERSQFLLALKYFELGELGSGQATALCGLPRTAFLLEAGRHGVPVTELDADEQAREFAQA